LPQDMPLKSNITQTDHTKTKALEL
jgi:hypothetical protein